MEKKQKEDLTGLSIPSDSRPENVLDTVIIGSTDDIENQKVKSNIYKPFNFSK